MIYLINIMVVYVIYAEFHLSVSTSLFSRKQKRRLAHLDNKCHLQTNHEYCSTQCLC